MKLYLVRHGESRDLAAGLHQHPDSPLTEAGHKQAGNVARRLAKLPIDLILSSPLSRAHQTARIIADQLQKPLEVTPLLTEQKRPAQVEGQRKDIPEVIKIRRQIRENIANPDYRHSDEETFTDFKTRITQLLELILQKGKTVEYIALVTHGMTARMIFAHILYGPKVSPEEFVNLADILSFSKTGLTIFNHNPELGWKLITWNDHAHLAD